jgi:hypothetical protein
MKPAPPVIITFFASYTSFGGVIFAHRRQLRGRTPPREAVARERAAAAEPPRAAQGRSSNGK